MASPDLATRLWFILDPSTYAIIALATVTNMYAAHRCNVFRIANTELAEAGTITKKMALLLPLVGSIVLLLFFYFLKIISILYLVLLSLGGSLGLAYTLNPLLRTILGAQRFIPPTTKLPKRCCRGELLQTSSIISGMLGLGLVLGWFFTNYWVLLDFVALGLAVASLSFIRLNSIKLSAILLSMFFLYDIFWVFFSEYIFEENVMVSVATRVNLPILIAFPHTFQIEGMRHFSMLGVGDIVMPGLLICFTLRFDTYLLRMHAPRLPETMQDVSTQHSPVSSSDTPQDHDHLEADLESQPLRSQASSDIGMLQAAASGAGTGGGARGLSQSWQALDEDSDGADAPGTVQCGAMAKWRRFWRRHAYFRAVLIGYVVGLFLASLGVALMDAAQPALLYLVPCTLGPVLIVGWRRGQVRALWDGFKPAHPIMQPSSSPLSGAGATDSVSPAPDHATDGGSAADGGANGGGMMSVGQETGHGHAPDHHDDGAGGRLLAGHDGDVGGGGGGGSGSEPVDSEQFHQHAHLAVRNGGAGSGVGAVRRRDEKSSSRESMEEDLGAIVAERVDV